MATTTSQHDSSTKPIPELEGQSETARLEKLGRQRPPSLTSRRQEIGFVFSIVMSQAILEYFVTGFIILIPPIAQALDIPAPAVTWPASAFSLVVSSFLLVFGRVADIHGGFPVYVAGMAWYCVWALVAGFAHNEIMLVMCRALQGLGPAAYLPAGLKLLGSIYRPGPRKNLIFSIYGAMAPLGFFIGILMAGISGEYIGWRWYFWIGSILAFLMTVSAFFTIPNDHAAHKTNDAKMDWYGSITLTTGLILLVFAITDSSHAPDGWSTPYIYVTFILSILLLSLCFYIEGWVATQPILPFPAFKTKYIRPFIFGLLFAYGTLGVYFLYTVLYTTNIMGASPIQLVAWYLPLGIGGILAATLGGFILHLVPATFLMFISTASTIGSSLLFALIPLGANYWAFVFPSMCLTTIAIDILFSAASIFFSTTLPARQQGLAGALSNVLLQLGIALLLGFGDIIANKTAWQGERQSYRNVFWFELACGAVAMVVFMGFVRVKSASSDYTADEKEARRKEEEENAVAMGGDK